MSKLRSLSTAFWSDPWIEDLDPQEKLLFIYLITNTKTNMLGIYEASVKKISFETGLSLERVRKALKGFERVGKVKYENNYVLVTNYIKHQNYNTNMKKSAIDVYNNLPKELRFNNLIVSKDNPLESFETLSNGLLMVSKYEVEYEYEVERETKVEYEYEVESKKEILGESSFEEIKKIFNSVCIDLPKVQSISEDRKKAIKKINKFHDLESIGNVFKKANESDFLSGRDSKWKANFDWLLIPKNFLKVLEDNYKNNSNGFNKNSNEIFDRTNQEIFRDSMESEAAKNFRFS